MTLYFEGGKNMPLLASFALPHFGWPADGGYHGLIGRIISGINEKV